MSEQAEAEVDVTIDPYCPFQTKDGGKTKGTATPVRSPLQAGQQITIDGSSDLHRVIVGESNACIYSISLTRVAALIYRLDVWGQGPKGIGSGWLNLRFFDESGDYYDLGLWDSDRKNHSVTYTSVYPDINKVVWWGS